MRDFRLTNDPDVDTGETAHGVYEEVWLITTQSA